MGECINLRRGGKTKALPVLNPNYPADCTGMRSNGYFDCVVNIAEHGYPSEYTYQWFINGTPYSGATHWSFSYGRMNPVGTYSIYCEVTNKAGTVRSRTATITLRDAFLWNWGDVTANSGGWQVTKTLASQHTAYSVGTLKYNSADQVTMDLPYSNDGFLAPKNKIDLTHYSKIRCYVYLYSDDADYPWYLSVASHNNPADNYLVASVELPYPNGSQYAGWRTAELDVSGITGSHYVGIRSWIYNDHAYCSIGTFELIP